MSRLKDRIIKRIQQDGDLSVAEYMQLCLLDPVDGFYPTRDPLGSDGDFITAPEISQMFGEVLGLWVLQSWIDMGRPKKVHLVEFGPGRGIMMSDMLRAASHEPDFLKAVSVTLIEASAALEAVQAKTLASSPVPVNWVSSLSAVPAEPIIIIANEYLDCLPIRQFVQKDRFAEAAGWHERMVTAKEGELQFTLSENPISSADQGLLPLAQSEAKTDEILEVRPVIYELLSELQQRFEVNPGRALFVDYGPDVTEFGDSLQALKRHEKVDLFSAPGDADLTARVDFDAMGQVADAMGVCVQGPVMQREFLSKLGVEMRAVSLLRGNPKAKAKIARQLDRLMSEDQMGSLFKAICLETSGLQKPLGFRATNN